MKGKEIPKRFRDEKEVGGESLETITLPWESLCLLQNYRGFRLVANINFCWEVKK